MPALRLLLLSMLCSRAFAFSNGNFETGTTSGWTVTYGTDASQGVFPSVTIVTPGAAPLTAGNLNRVYGGSYACQLASGVGPLNHASWARISQTDVINANNSLLSFYYAAVLDGTHATTPSEDAYMQVWVFDNTTGLTITYRNYFYASSPAALVYDGYTDKMHLPWTNITIDLSAYAGHSVTISFTAYDCTYGGHDSLAYVDGFEFVTPTYSSTVSPSFTVSPTRSATRTATPTFSYSPTITLTPTQSATRTVTPTFSHSPTATLTRTPSTTFSFSPTLTATPTHTPTLTHSATLTATKTWSPTPTYTATLTYSASLTITKTWSPTPTHTPTFTVTPSFSDSPTRTMSPTFSFSPTITPTFSISPTFTITETFTPVLTPINQPSNASICAIYPNPFQDHATVCVILKEDSDMLLTIYNVAGEVILSFGKAGFMGGNMMDWKGENSYGGRVASGVYILRLQATTKSGDVDLAWGQAVVAR